MVLQLHVVEILGLIRAYNIMLTMIPGHIILRRLLMGNALFLTFLTFYQNELEKCFSFGLTGVLEHQPTNQKLDSFWQEEEEEVVGRIH